MTRQTYVVLGMGLTPHDVAEVTAENEQKVQVDLGPRRLTEIHSEEVRGTNSIRNMLEQYDVDLERTKELNAVLKENPELVLVVTRADWESP